MIPSIQYVRCPCINIWTTPHPYTQACLLMYADTYVHMYTHTQTNTNTHTISQKHRHRCLPTDNHTKTCIYIHTHVTKTWNNTINLLKHIWGFLLHGSKKTTRRVYLRSSATDHQRVLLHSCVVRHPRLHRPVAPPWGDAVNTMF